jgi:hypothetical protein
VLYSLPLDTIGSEREPKLWPNTHFRRQPKAAAADLSGVSLCAISSSRRPRGWRTRWHRGTLEVPELLRERDDVERVVTSRVGRWGVASLWVGYGLRLGLFRNGAVRAHLAAVHHEFEAREVLFEQPRPDPSSRSARVSKGRPASSAYSPLPIVHEGFTGIALASCGR